MAQFLLEETPCFTGAQVEMASVLSCVFVLVLSVTLFFQLSVADEECKGYKDSFGNYQFGRKCYSREFCCGTCTDRYCCSIKNNRFTEDDQERCDRGKIAADVPVLLILSIVASIVAFFSIIICCICPCCCIYKLCRRQQPVMATTTHTTVVTSTPLQYPQQPTATPGSIQTYQGVMHQPYQPIPAQPGYGTQPMPYPGQQFTPGAPPTYQEATYPAYPPQQMPYSQAAYTPGQPTYPLQPPRLQGSAGQQQMDFLSQPAYNPDFVVPPKTA